MPYRNNRSTQAIAILDLHVQNGKDATVTIVSNDGMPKI